MENFQYFDKEIVCEIIDIFLNEYPARLKSIADNIESGDNAGLKFNAHSMKGVIANFIALEPEQCARELEVMGTENNMEGAKELFEDFKECSSIMVEELEELKKQFE